MGQKAKVLMIGIDAADQRLIRLWARDGLLPTFKILLEQATWGITTNPIGFYVGAVWPSFSTGLSPVRHGRYCYTQLGPGSYKTFKTQVTDVKGEPFWKTLSDAGRRVGIVDVPKTFLTPNLNGIQIVDWGTHDPDFIGQLYTYPETLAADIENQFGRDPVGDCNTISRTVEGYRQFRDDLIHRIETKTALSKHFLNQGNWDLFLTVFSESHCVGHQCWNLHDPHHPKHQSDIVQLIGDPLLAVYQALDKAVGELVAEVDPETPVFILASHGMGPHYDGTFLLDDILCRLENIGVSAAKQQFAKALNTNLEEVAGLSWFLKPLKQLVWKPLRDRFWRSDKPFRKAMAEPDASRRKCFTVPNNDVYGAIRVNLVGREPKGQIHPGAEYDRFCEQLTHDLTEIVNLDTGKPLVKQVLRTADLYQGECLDTFPDLLIEWNREKPIQRVSSQKIGVLEKTFAGVRTGDHQPNGMFFAINSAMPPGQLENVVSVTDFAPTIAELLNVVLPDVDGQSILERHS
ncbi:alkaline phosphatase family protein [Oscillatoria sp. FACHB-1407]|uniref:alkaline phosphatase family protein n=1 Tax=Oscillatoria sp. FACHB-1407 TaxID=2692847 RepID=UPI001686DA14|nr:alkaline phosphatase family protein [Oscillatoria sp. FACHB-1407]MBD2463367.1 alkaline phosphatase family protein [Oscillatoria sp. FACHB-1407]